MWLIPLAAAAQDAGPDGGTDADTDTDTNTGTEGDCGADPPCDPPLRCIDDRCGECGNLETRACDEGCGAGTQQCNYDSRSWGQCTPTGAVECDINEDTDLDGDPGPPPQNPCDHACGTGYNPCSPVDCTYQRDNCIRADFNPVTQRFDPIEISCTPGGVGESCFFGPNLCRGTRPCLEDCSWGDCQPDPTIPCCGNFVLDPGEKCDGEPECDMNRDTQGSAQCEWAQARPFRSFDCGCHTPGDSAGQAWLAALAVVPAARFLRRRTA